jgi:hypothetical protein
MPPVRSWVTTRCDSGNKMKSFIAYSETSDFPIENLPYGIFSTAENVRYVTNIVYGVK